MSGVLLDVAGLTVDFAGTPAVRGVDLTLRRGEVLGLVGESGSGKSATALAVLGLLPPHARVAGSVRLEGRELLGAPDRELSRIRGSRVAMVFQDPLSAFTPVHRIGDQISEAVRAHREVSRAAAADRAVELLDLVGIPEPRLRARAFPHEFSGGMRQRAMIAMAMANDPDVILADEPTTALDVTVQAQVLDVLGIARRATGAAMVLVSHDLGVIAGMADQVAVMYAGRVVERGTAEEVFGAPRMPYTQGLLRAVPRLDRARAALVPVPGEPPSAGDLPPGCPFAPRCALAQDRCRAGEPGLTQVGEATAGGPRAGDGAAADPAPEGGGARAAGEAGAVAYAGGVRAPLAPLPHLAACVRVADTGGFTADGGPGAARAEHAAWGAPGPDDGTPDERAGTGAATRVGTATGAGAVPGARAAADTLAAEALAGAAGGAVARAAEGHTAQAPAGGAVLRVRGLVRTFPVYKGAVLKRRVGSVHAVDGVDLDLLAGQTLALVGESGSGKSTTLFELLELAPPEGGTVELFGQSLDRLDKAARAALRRRIQIVFQDPAASLDPRMTIGDIVAEPLRAQGAGRDRVARRVPELLRQVGLSPRHADLFPHEFSGGQRQRVGIARALSVDPELLVMDEPVSALDVSVRAGVLNLLQRLRADLGLTYLFVSHDLSVVRQIADRVSVVYLGRTVESGPVDAVFARPRHPYTQALLSAVPVPDPVRERQRERILLPGDPPSPTRRFTGCRFRARCPLHAELPPDQRERCAAEVPQPTGRAGEEPAGAGSGDAETAGAHTVACHFPRAREAV